MLVARGLTTAVIARSAQSAGCIADAGPDRDRSKGPEHTAWAGRIRRTARSGTRRCRRRRPRSRPWKLPSLLTVRCTTLPGQTPWDETAACRCRCRVCDPGGPWLACISGFRRGSLFCQSRQWHSPLPSLHLTSHVLCTCCRGQGPEGWADIWRSVHGALLRSETRAGAELEARADHDHVQLLQAQEELRKRGNWAGLVAARS